MFKVLMIAIISSAGIFSAYELAFNAIGLLNVPIFVCVAVFAVLLIIVYSTIIGFLRSFK